MKTMKILLLIVVAFASCIVAEQPQGQQQGQQQQQQQQPVQSQQQPQQQQQPVQSQQQPQQQQQQRRQKNKATIYYSPECREDVLKYCGRARLSELSDLALLQCLHDENKDLSVLVEPCQHLIYIYKLNLTKTLNLNPTTENVCKEEIEKFTDCKNTDDKNGHLAACLIEKRAEMTDGQCKAFLTNVAALIFSDYHLVYKFQDKCDAEIKRLKCGRLPGNEDTPTDQGKTIECLSASFGALNKDCRTEIFRIAELQSDDFHLDRPLFFACKEDREKFCKSIVSGNGRVYKCLLENKFKDDMSKPCLEQLTRRQKMIVEDIEVDKSFINACKNDILKNDCRNELRVDRTNDMKLSAVLLCLEGAARNGNELEPECKNEIVEHRKMLFSDYQLNPDLMSACENEINTYCKRGIERGGKTLRCLFHNAKLSKTRKNQSITFKAECINELRKLVKVADAGEDARVDPHLYESCQNLITGVCKSVNPGEGRLIDCLLKNLGTDEMNENCEERLLEIQFFVARDWKLSPLLYKVCKEDAINLCSAKGSWNDKSTDVDNSPLVLPCLYHHINVDEESNAEKTDDNKQRRVSQACAIEVKRVMHTRAKSIDLIPEVQDACTYDLTTKCSNIETNKKGEELSCLQDKYEELEKECKDAITKYTSYESKDIRLDQILMKSCLPIVNEFCADERDEKGDLLECLIRQKNNPNIDIKCHIGIEHHQLINLKNIDFNYKFKRQCELNIKQYCSDMTSKIEIIQCLSAHVLNDTLLDQRQRIAPLCRSQLKFELLQMNENVKLDPVLYDVCKSDINEHCANIEPGKANVLECLKKNIDVLSKACASKISRREKIDLVDQSIDFKLNERCKSAIREFCSEIDGGHVDIIACLRKNLLNPKIDPPCRKTVISRIIAQNKDPRLNIGLWKVCKHDTDMYCKSEYASLANKDEFGERVIKCLKNKFVENSLSRDCSLEIEQIMREAANVDYRLDPLLTEACLTQIHTLCENDADDKKEDCLRLAFQQRKIDPKSEAKCYQEVKRIIIEGAADIFTDHELHQACYSDIQRLCYDVPMGAAQHLKCLMEAQDSKRLRLGDKCAQLLIKRRELWNLAQVSNDLTGFKDLYTTINASENRLYIFGVLITVVFVVFMLGCTLRPAVFRSRWDKLK